MKTILILIITVLSLTSCVSTQTTLSNEQQQEMIDNKESIRQWRNSTTPEERIRTIQYNQYKTEKFLRRYR